MFLCASIPIQPTQNHNPVLLDSTHLFIPCILVKVQMCIAYKLPYLQNSTHMWLAEADSISSTCHSTGQILLVCGNSQPISSVPPFNKVYFIANLKVFSQNYHSFHCRRNIFCFFNLVISELSIRDNKKASELHGRLWYWEWKSIDSREAIEGSSFDSRGSQRSVGFAVNNRVKVRGMFHHL